MSYFGPYSDHNHDIFNILSKLENDKYYDICGDGCDDTCDHKFNYDRSQYQLFEKVIDLDELQKYADYIILGILIRYTRPINHNEILSAKLTQLSDNYPESYKTLARKVIIRMDSCITIKNLEHEGWYTPQTRYDAFQDEKQLFFSSEKEIFIGR